MVQLYRSVAKMNDFTRAYLASQGIGYTRRRCCGVSITERIDPRIEIIGKLPDYERGDYLP